MSLIHIRVAAFGALLLALSGAAFGCTCIPPGSPRQEAVKSAVVFVGTVSSVQTFFPQAPPAPGSVRSFIEDVRSVLTGRKGLPKTTTRDPYTVITFLVSETLKGRPARILRVEAGSPASTCGLNFQVGKEYVVYGSSYLGRLATGACSRTALSSNPRAGLRELRQGI